MKERCFAVLVIVIFLISFAGANFQVGNLSHSIQKSYGPSGVITGWINISLENEPVNSIFETNFGDSISLIKLVKLNEEEKYDINYSCNIKGCDSDYSQDGAGEAVKSFRLNKGESEMFGFKLTGNIESINSVRFEVESNAPSSCFNQLKIDLFADGKIDAGNIKSSNQQQCSNLKNYGCFDSNGATKEGVIDITPYCQKIKLSESPGFTLGAWIRKGVEAKKITVALYNKIGESIEGGNCTLPEANSYGGEVSCTIDYSVIKSDDYYVCIYSKEGGSYKIRASESPINKCGFHGTPLKSEVSAYQIFATGSKFSEMGNLELNETYPDSLSSDIENYIRLRYGGFDCLQGCIVPINFISGEDQDVKIKNLLVKYNTFSLSGVEEKTFYKLREIPGKINMNLQKIFISGANFSVPDEYGEKNFELRLNGMRILFENISVEKIPIINSISPTTTFSAFPTEFRVNARASEGNITSYQWEFGDGKSETTKKDRVTHIYNSTGIYNLKITVIDSNQKSSSKIFNIIVGSPKDAINITLERKTKNLEDLKKQINDFEGFYREALNSAIDIDKFNSELQKLQKDYKKAGSDSEYNSIVAGLINLKIPEVIFESESSNPIFFYPKESEINLEVLKEVGGGNYDSSNEDEYINSILSWNEENMETKIIFKEFSAKYGHETERIIGVFELKIKEKKSLSYNPYLIIKKVENIKFKESYSEREKPGYIYIHLTESEDEFIFSTTEEVNFINLPAFISPPLNRLSVSKTGEIENGSKISKWIIFVLLIILLLIIATVGYILMKRWYKTRYESYLFKNKNNLYNLIRYIDSSKRRGATNPEIEKRLKNSGWKSEQIKYAMKKYAGKF